MRRRGLGRRGAVAFLLAVALAVPGPRCRSAWAVATEDDALDRSGLLAIVTHGAAAAADAKQRKTYAKLQHALEKQNRHGLVDDYPVLGKVSKACAKTLAGDTALLAALEVALDAGEAALDADDDELTGLAGLLDPGKPQSRVRTLAAKARAKATDAAARRDAGDRTGAIRVARAAAVRFDAALKYGLKARQKLLPRDATWSQPLAGVGGALLSVTGERGFAPTLYAVGSDDGAGPLFLVLRQGGEGWVRVPAAPSGDLWWTTIVPRDGVWASGSDGLVVRYDPATGGVTDRSTGVHAILYGVWGSGPTDVWAVGGDPDGTGPTPALLHWDGDSWQAVAAPAQADGQILYKVWGSGTADVWTCGQGGVVLHYDGSGWSPVDSGTSSTLITVNGSSPTIAVGGGGVAAVIVERGSSGTWGPVTVASGTPALNGVFVPPSGEAVAVGFMRTVLRRSGSSWSAIDGIPVGARDLHAVWIDDEGNAVMVGGDLFGLASGVLVAYGRRTLPSTIVPQTKLRARVEGIFAGSCAEPGCHLSPASVEGMEFSSASSIHTLTVGVPSHESLLQRIFPGRPSQSYLWHKLQGTQGTVGGSGNQMPNGRDPLSPDDLDAMRAWILEGALDN